MEAASARFAARDRFGPLGFTAQTPLQRYIQNAVDPQQNYEPNLALNLEITDLINSKKGSAPREAAVAIVNYVNHRNPNVSLLALNLLDICVKNCGYPFHLQISTKDFLNELVRKFAEKPPVRPSRVQLKVLELIEEWRQTICQTSRYKEDLGFIRDMHRLLSYKGYMFPEVRREDAAVLNRSENLQSAEEMEEEEKAAQSAKLQELIRRGGPADLQEANRLMKVMAGYDTRHKTDYRAKAAEEVGKVQQKARLLEERLQNVKPGEKIADGDVYEELVSALQSAHPKIQKMCEEESDDAEAVAKLLEINDSIHRTIERYKLIKQGDLDGASKIPKGTLGTSTGVSKTAGNELSLIDFDADAAPEQQTNGGGDASSASQATSVEDDLLGLSLQNPSYGQTGGIALGFGANSNIPGPSLLSSTSHQPTAGASVSQPSSQQAAQQSPQPNYNAFSNFASAQTASGAATPTPQAAFTSPPPQAQSSQPSSDPFKSISSNFSRPPQSQPATSGSLFDLSSAPAQAKSAQPPTATDDDWEFASALPEDKQHLPSSNDIVVANSSVKILFKASRSPPSPDTVSIAASISNNTPQLISEFTFQVAVTKGFSLKLAPQSGRNLLPSQQNGITQPITISGVAKGQANSVKVRWKASYKLGTEAKQEQGEAPPLGIE